MISHTLRTPEMRQKYLDAVASGALSGGCALCKDRVVVKQFEHWRIVKNDFPYDAIATVHDMIVPNRHIQEGELTAEEERELVEIKDNFINDTYEFIIEATHKTKSIPAHFHLHLVVLKDNI